MNKKSYHSKTVEYSTSTVVLVEALLVTRDKQIRAINGLGLQYYSIAF